MSESDKTHFGYKQVDTKDKVKMVRNVFHSVAGKYDLMNDLMSMGVHRIWKRIAVEFVRAREGHRILDLAGGTGDLTILMSKNVGRTGEIVVCDINDAMLNVGRDRLINKGIVNNIRYV
ncbi:MAG: class I SAM-dependent methyltransferase, partial [Gammaproteobacteria bacterium]|nr:class I SAM-dependent methyltransferase [Gammaproteobacteria bacterium]